MRYFKDYWNESAGAGDPRDVWGRSWWYFEADESGNEIRQIIVYEHGPTVRHGLANLDDEYGGLSEKPIDLVEMAPHEISFAEFEVNWLSPSVINAKPVLRA